MENNDKRGFIIILIIAIVVVGVLYVTMDKEREYKHPRYGMYKELMER